MKREEIDEMWHKAMIESITDGEQFTRYHFAKMVAEECAKVCDEQEKRSRAASESAKRESDRMMYHHCAVTAKWNADAIRSLYK